MKITLYAYARNFDGRPEQIKEERENQKMIKREWTGIYYKNDRDALNDMRRLNCNH